MSIKIEGQDWTKWEETERYQLTRSEVTNWKRASEDVVISTINIGNTSSALENWRYLVYKPVKNNGNWFWWDNNDSINYLCEMYITND